MQHIIELEELIQDYGEREVSDMIRYWQDDPAFPFLSCPEHRDLRLKFRVKSKTLYCPNSDCPYHQHYIPRIILDYWKRK